MTTTNKAFQYNHPLSSTEINPFTPHVSFPFVLPYLNPPFFLAQSSIPFPAAELSPNMSDGALYVASLCAAVSLAFIWKWRCRESRLSFPPGPKGLPLLGNVFDIPKGVPVWLAFTSMSKKYSMYLFRPAFSQGSHWSDLC